MVKKGADKIPLLFGWFIILAMLPQFLGFNGSMFDTLYKLVAVGTLTFIMVLKYNSGKISMFSIFYMLVSVINVSGTVLINNVSFFTEITALVTELLLLYILYEGVKDKFLTTVDAIHSFYKVIAYFMLVASIYNMIIHFNSLLHITSLTLYSSENMSSFFDNKNTYGVFLIFGSLAASILSINLKETKWSVFTLIFLINELMAMCRTAVLITSVLIVASLFISRGKKIKDAVLLTMVVAVVLILTKSVGVVNNFITNNLFSDTDSLEARNKLVECMLPLIRGKQFWFGYGNTNASSLALRFTGNRYYHNTYLKNAIVGGVINFALQILVILKSISYGFKCKKYDKNIGNLCLVSTMVYLIYAGVEAVVLLDTPVVSIMATMFIVSMPILFYNALSNEKSEL